MRFWAELKRITPSLRFDNWRNKFLVFAMVFLRQNPLLEKYVHFKKSSQKVSSRSVICCQREGGGRTHRPSPSSLWTWAVPQGWCREGFSHTQASMKGGALPCGWRAGVLGWGASVGELEGGAQAGGREPWQEREDHLQEPPVFMLTGCLLLRALQGTAEVS